MLGSDFIDKYKKYQALSLVGIQDWADRMSYQNSVVIFMLCTIVVTAKTYILAPLKCHVPTSPSGSDFDKYFNSYCWVHGTTPLRLNESMPEDDVGWVALEEERKLSYYQWVPFMLGLQTIMFYLPFVVWKNITFNRLGTDLTAIIVKAMDALKTTSPKARQKQIANVALRLELLLFAHRDFRRGTLAEMKRKMHKMCGIFLVSKRMGTWTVFSYLCIKIAYLVNAIGQLYLMKHFLGHDEDIFAFGWQSAQALTNGVEWRESLYFPRIAFCSATIRHLGQKDNRFVGMCVLPINMLNEKIYIFLWFWTLAVAIATQISIITWLVRLSIRRRQGQTIRKYLKLSPIIEKQGNDYGDGSQYSSDLDPENPAVVDRFVREFLRLDGVFIVQMLTLNAGDVLTGEVIRLLWHSWVTKYANRNFGLDLWSEYQYHQMDEIDKLKLEAAEKQFD